MAPSFAASLEAGEVDYHSLRRRPATSNGLSAPLDEEDDAQDGYLDFSAERPSPGLQSFDTDATRPLFIQKRSIDDEIRDSLSSTSMRQVATSDNSPPSYWHDSERSRSLSSSGVHDRPSSPIIGTPESRHQRLGSFPSTHDRPRPLSEHNSLHTPHHVESRPVSSPHASEFWPTYAETGLRTPVSSGQGSDFIARSSPRRSHAGSTSAADAELGTANAKARAILGTHEFQKPPSRTEKLAKTMKSVLPKNRKKSVEDETLARLTARSARRNSVHVRQDKNGKDLWFDVQDEDSFGWVDGQARPTQVTSFDTGDDWYFTQRGSGRAQSAPLAPAATWNVKRSPQSATDTHTQMSEAPDFADMFGSPRKAPSPPGPSRGAQPVVASGHPFATSPEGSLGRRRSEHPLSAPPAVEYLQPKIRPEPGIHFEYVTIYPPGPIYERPLPAVPTSNARKSLLSSTITHSGPVSEEPKRYSYNDWATQQANGELYSNAMLSRVASKRTPYTLAEFNASLTPMWTDAHYAASTSRDARGPPKLPDVPEVADREFSRYDTFPESVDSRDSLMFLLEREITRSRTTNSSSPLYTLPESPLPESPGVLPQDLPGQSTPALSQDDSDEWPLWAKSPPWSSPSAMLELSPTKDDDTWERGHQRSDSKVSSASTFAWHSPGTPGVRVISPQPTGQKVIPNLTPEYEINRQLLRGAVEEPEHSWFEPPTPTTAAGSEDDEPSPLAGQMASYIERRHESKRVSWMTAKV